MFKSKLLLLTCGGCLGLLCLGVASRAGLVYWSYTSVEKTVSPRVDAIFRAIEGGAFAKSYDTQTAVKLRERVTREEYDAFGEMIRLRLGSLKSKSLVFANMRQHNAESFLEATYSATFERASGTILAKMVKEDGDWKFLTFRVDSPLFDSDLSTMSCLQCGVAHAVGDRFCPGCGVELLQNEQQETEEKDRGTDSDQDEPAETVLPEDERQG